MIGVIRKCQKWAQHNAPSRLEFSPFFGDRTCLTEVTSLNRKNFAEYVDANDSELWDVPFTDPCIMKTPSRLQDVKCGSTFIKNYAYMQSPDSKHYIIEETNRKFRDDVLNESCEVLPDPNSPSRTVVDHTREYDYPLYQFRPINGGSTSALTKEKDCFLFDSSSVRDANICSTSNLFFAMHDAVESSSNNRKFRSSSLSDVRGLRLRRSNSAPPFYRRKKKFPILTCLSTDYDRENSKITSSHGSDETGLNCQLEHYNASQPCLKLSTKLRQPCLREFKQEKLNQSDMIAKQTLEEFDCGFVPDEIKPESITLTKWRTGRLQPAINHDGAMPLKIDVLDVSSGLLHLAGSSLVPASINKDCLDDARALLQLDCKFIPVVASGILVIIDQHAADERIRLEELRKKVLNGEFCSSTYLTPEHELVLPEMGYQLLQKYAEQIKKWGWICDINSQCSESFSRSMNFLRQHNCRAILVAVPHILGTDLTGKDLLEYIEQLVETDGSSTIPPAVLRILNYKACRGAIMFGDALLPSECSLIVEELKATSLCFQCAHGRPTTVPLLNMSALHEQLARLDKQMAGRHSDEWHGLRRHTVSIGRAQERLELCKRFLHG